jgi:hypothetical protein
MRDMNGCGNMSIVERKQYIMKLADDMAAAATSINSQGYELFLNARESLLQTIDKIGDLAAENEKTITTLVDVLKAQHKLDFPLNT